MPNSFSKRDENYPGEILKGSGPAHGVLQSGCFHNPTDELHSLNSEPSEMITNRTRLLLFISELNINRYEYLID